MEVRTGVAEVRASPSGARTCCAIRGIHLNSGSTAGSARAVQRDRSGRSLCFGPGRHHDLADKTHLRATDFVIETRRLETQRAELRE